MSQDSKKEKKNFLKGVRSELKKVVWPTPKELATKTMAVIAVALIVMGLVFVFDLAFSKIDELGIGGLKSAVQKQTDDTTDSGDEHSEDDGHDHSSDADNAIDVDEEGIDVTAE